MCRCFTQNPDLLLFDEPESGVDMENIALVGKVIAKLLGKTTAHDEKSILQVKKERKKMGLIITHTGYILNYLPADKGHILYQGVIGCSGIAGELLQCVSEQGYEECVRCSIENK